MKHTIRYIYIALAALLQTGCSDTLNTPFAPGEWPIHEAEIAFSVNETEWEGQTVSMTRSVETMRELQTSGFGIFCDELSLTNQKVSWDALTGRWNYGDKMLWPKNKVNKDIKMFAYAPYDEGIEWKGNSINAKDSTADWLWGEPSVDDNGIICMNFQHALAKLSFGSIINTYGSTITLKSVEVKELRSAQSTIGNLSLADGTWSPVSGETYTYTKNYCETPKTVTEGETTTEETGLEIENGDAKFLDIADILQIPGVEVTVVFTLETYTDKDIKIEKKVTLERRGVNTEINLTVGQNHGVVIQ